MERLIAIISLLFISSLSRAVDKDSYEVDRYRIQPLAVSSYNSRIIDLWATGSYFFTPFSDVGIYGGINTYYMKNQFANLGVEAEMYSKRNNRIKYGLGLGYSGGGFYERNDKDIRLNSHWGYVDMYIRFQYICLGLQCETLIAKTSENAYESSIFRYNDCYFPLVPIGYMGLLSEFSKFKIEIRLGVGRPQLDPQKMFLMDTGTLHSTFGLYAQFKLSYKFFSTSRTNLPAGWW